MKPADTRYSAFDHELLAMYLAVKQFQHFVKGCQFHVLTDHKPLTFAFSTQLSKLTLCQTRHLDFISQFTTNALNISSSNNPIADALTCIKLCEQLTFQYIKIYRHLSYKLINSNLQVSHLSVSNLKKKAN